MTEILLVVLISVVLLAGLVAQGFAYLGMGRRWPLVTTCLRVAAVILLASAWALTASRVSEWTPYDLRQGALGLGTAAMSVLLALSLLGRKHMGIREGGATTDLLVLALSLFAASVWPGAPTRPCIQAILPFWIQWGFCLLGLGASAVAASAGLAVLLAPRLVAQPANGSGTQAEVRHWLLRQATSLALLLLGSGLVASVFWSRPTLGTLDPTMSGADPRLEWMGIAWLIAAASHLAWQLKRRPMTWAALLAMLAAFAGILGLLGIPDLLRLSGL